MASALRAQAVVYDGRESPLSRLLILYLNGLHVCNPYDRFGGVVYFTDHRLLLYHPYRAVMKTLEVLDKGVHPAQASAL